ncbi:MAG TPA: J domain-containing protein [Chloroflexota bacterium]|nr:J domain-containing protein [Chloroflexota bacterium]
MTSEDREIGRGGVVMLGSAAVLAAATYFSSGGLPHGIAAGLLCGMAGIGAARLVIGAYYARRVPAGVTSAAVIEADELDELDSLPDTPRNAFEANFWVLGLDVDADLRSVKRAYRERRAMYLHSFTPASRFQLAEIEAAYRQLRRMLAPRGTTRSAYEAPRSLI